MSDKMSEVEAAKKAVLAKWPSAFEDGTIWFLSRKGVTQNDDVYTYLGTTWLSVCSEYSLLVDGTFNCPICGLAGPHNHSADEIAASKLTPAAVAGDATRKECGCAGELHKTSCNCTCGDTDVDPLCRFQHSWRANPVGEREGEFEDIPEEVQVIDLVSSLHESWKAMEPGVDTCYTFEGQLGINILKLRAALASKQSAEGILERPKATGNFGGNLACNVHDVYSYCDKVEAIISDKDAEIASEQDRTQQRLNKMSIAMKVDYERAESAKSELSALKLSSARIEEETLRKAWEAVTKEREENHFAHLVGASHGKAWAYANGIHDAEMAILALIPTSPGSQAEGE